MKWEKVGLIFEPPNRCEWIVSHASVPVALILDDAVCRIYFSGRNAQNQSSVGYFEIGLEDPFNILRVAEAPVITPGERGMFDDSGAMGSWLTRVGDKIYFYYIGWSLAVSVPFRNAIGLAVSEDNGQSFRKHALGPVLDRSIHDPCFTASCCVLVEGGVWRMWYLSCQNWEIERGVPKHHYDIRYAESKDGIHWSRDGIICVGPEQDDEYAFSRPCVIRDDDGYKMWYSYRGSRYRIGYAESEDGLRWERKDESVGIAPSPTGWDSEMIEYPHVFDYSGRRYMLYNGNDYGKSGVGLAVLSND